MVGGDYYLCVCLRECVCVFLTLYQRCVNAVGLCCLQGRVHVEQVGHERHVEFAVASTNILGRHKLPAVQPGSLLQHELSPVLVISLLCRQTHTHCEHKNTYAKAYTPAERLGQSS